MPNLSLLIEHQQAMPMTAKQEQFIWELILVRQLKPDSLERLTARLKSGTMDQSTARATIDWLLRRKKIRQTAAERMPVDGLPPLCQAHEPPLAMRAERIVSPMWWVCTAPPHLIGEPITIASYTIEGARNDDEADQARCRLQGVTW